MRKPPLPATSSPSRTSQRGGFFLGLVVGVLLGLAAALGVALYVTKVPVPFINKVPQRTAEQDAAEAVRNKDWDPNAPLAGKNPARPASAAPAASGVVTAASAASAPATASTASAPGTGTSVAPPAAASKSGAAAASAPNAAASKGAARDPAALLGDKAAPAAVAASTAGGSEAFVYFVQAGAYARVEEAEAQRAKLAIRGFESRITEREQSGRTIYRVRIGPFDGRGEAEGVQGGLTDAGVETALVRVQK